MNDAICCQLSMHNKDRVGALAACGVRDNGREDPSLSALHRVWPACPGGIRSLSLLCLSRFFILKPTYWSSSSYIASYVQSTFFASLGV